MTKEMGRRDFVKGMALTGITIAGAATLSGCGESSTSGNSGSVKWDEETDVIVVGSGFAGLAAAIEAKNGGAEVKVIEKMDMPGGNSVINGGGMAVCSSKYQAEKGVEDSVDLMVQDMLNAGLKLNHVEKCQKIAELSNETFEWTIDYLGVEWGDWLTQYGGHSVPRSRETVNIIGADIVKPQLAKLKELGVNVDCKRKLEAFIQDDDGRVIGIEVKDGYKFGTEDSGESLYIKARKAVILASGGFGADVPMRTAQNPQLDETMDITNHKGATGEALRQAIRIGAAPVQLSWIQIGPWASPDEQGFGVSGYYAFYNYPYAPMVSKTTGKRVVNELGDRKQQADAIMESGDPCIQIIDHRNILDYNLPYLEAGLKNGVVHKFDNLDDLAAFYDIPAEPMKAEVERYNSFVLNKNDLDFGKQIRDDHKTISEAPFYGSRMWPKVHHCMGGVGTDADGRVVDIDGQIIPGFFGAGEVTGGIHGACRLGSCAVADCLVYGRLTGQLAAKEESWA